MTAARKFKIALVQMSMGPEPEANLASAIAKIRESARLGAEVVCLPELFTAQYFCQREDAVLFDLAEPIPGPTTHKLAAVALETKTILIASLFERRTAGLYHNTAVTFGQDGSILSVYRKMHIPDDPLYYEKFYFAPGDLGFQAVDTSVGKIGTLVCWDQWYPEGARMTALKGAEILFYPTAIGWHPAERPSTAKPNTMHGRPSSAVTQSPTESMLRASIASATSTVKSSASERTESVLSSGVAAFWPIPLAASSPRLHILTKRF